MKKIMFNDTYGLTSAVLQGRKTMTWRIVKDANLLQWLHEMEVAEYAIKGTIVEKYSPYKIGEVVAIAQSYLTILNELEDTRNFSCMEHWESKSSDRGKYAELAMYSPGGNNKMFVKADLMPNRIRITDVKIERLQDISVRDCMREGIEDIHLPQLYQTGNHAYTFDGCTEGQIFGEINGFASPLAAFAALIDKVSGRGTWERNPWVFVYSYELVK